MKYFGMLLVILAGSGLGLYFSRRLYRRVWLLGRAQRLLSTLEHRLLYTAKPLAALWRELAETPAFADDRLLQETVRGLDTLPFREAFARAVDRLGSVMQPEDRRLLAEFGDGCGQTGLQEEAAHIRHYIQQLERLRQEAEQRAASRGQVYRAVGAAAGIGLALLML